MHIQPYLFFDGRCEGKPNFQGFSLSLTVKTEAEADRYFAALGAGGQLLLEGTVKTYRYVDDEEAAAAQPKKGAPGAKKPAPPPAPPKKGGG